MASCEVEFDGYLLGASSDSISRLRILNTSRFVGFGSPRVRQPATDRLAGGGHLGRASVEPRLFEAGTLLASDWAVARNFATSMYPSPGLLPLTFNGPAYPEKVIAFVSPQGVSLPLDAEGQQKDVIHLVNASWVAPDPTIYSASAFEETVVATEDPLNPPTVEWTNPGNITPVHGVGEDAWIVDVEVLSGIGVGVTFFVDEFVDSTWVETGLVRVQSLLQPGDKLSVGGDRIPRIIRDDTVTAAVAESYVNGVWVPQPFWPKFKPNVQSRVGVWANEFPGQGMSVEATMQFRGTWG